MNSSRAPPISALRVFPIIAFSETCLGASGYTSNEKYQVANSGSSN